MESNQEPKNRKPRAVWKDLNVDKTFLECCIEEVNLNGKEGASLKPKSWKKISETLKAKHNFLVDQKQMRNRWDYLKNKYGVWLKLKNKTGNIYDPSTNNFTMTDEEWAIEIEANKYVMYLKNSPLPFPELCTQLFEGSVGTGLFSYGSSSRDPEPTTEPFVVETETEETETSSPKLPTSSASSGRGKRKRNVSSHSDVDEEIINFLRSVNMTTNTPNNPEAYSYTKCFEKLMMLGLAKDDPLLRIGMALVTETKNREAWMSIPIEFAADWIRTVGEMNGLK